MQSFNLDDWRGWRREGFARLPVVRVERSALFPSNWETLTSGPATVLLESAQMGRYSYVAGAPRRVIIGEADRAQILPGLSNRPPEIRAGTPCDVLRSLLEETAVPRLPNWPAMTGGLMGVLGYDLVRIWERLPVSARRDLSLPLYAFIEPAELFVYDHLEKTLGIIVWCDVEQPREEAALSAGFEHGKIAVDRAWARWQAACNVRSRDAGAATNRDLRERERVQSFSAGGFQAAVKRAQEYISAGHSYQVNLSLRASQPIVIAPERVYEALRRINPSPYMGFLRVPGFSLVCGSPELLVRLVDGVIVSRPIAGTRPRGSADAQDRHLSAELLASEKERAEHLMLVDLIRNDIGRVARFGTVHVSEFMAVEQYSHVMHIVSQVEGKLAADRTWVDVLQSMFPGGTITGCPKIRTMEIIEELEPVGRGFYTGALGWISYAGEMEMNIVIRSMLVQDGLAHVQAGAGIVADSEPSRELDEALRKAQALWVALDQASEAHD